MVVIRSPADQIPVHHAGLVHESTPADLEVEFALWNRRHLAPINAICPGGNLHTVTYTRDGLVLLEKVSRYPHQILVIAKVFRRTTPREKDTCIIIGVDILKRYVRLYGVPLEFPCHLPVPVGRYLVQHHMITPFLRPCNHRLESILLQPVVGIKCIHRLCCLTDNNQDFIHRVFPFL